MLVLQIFLGVLLAKLTYSAIVVGTLTIIGKKGMELSVSKVSKANDVPKRTRKGSGSSAKKN